MRDPESIAVLEDRLIMITSIERVGIFEVYMQAQAKGSMSPEVLALTIEADDTFNLINWAPMFSEPVKSEPIMILG